jgi:SulP family sulfate permease
MELAKSRLLGTLKLLPIATWLPSYERTWLRADTVAAIVVAAVLVPQAMAYATLAGVSPEAGLYAAAVPLLLYPIFGTCRQLSVGPGSTMSVLVAATVAPLAAGDGQRYVALAAGLALMVGITLIVAGIARLGLISDFFAKPVLTGFVGGLALLIAVGQVPALLGIEGGGENFFDEAWHVIENTGDTDASTLLVGAGCLIALFGLNRFLPVVPSALVVVVGATVVSAAFDLEGEGVTVVGEFAGGLPPVEIPDMRIGDIVDLLPGAIGISFVAFAESNAAARQIATRHKYEVDPNAELIALGAANVGTGFTQGFVVDASLSRSATADESGMKTQVSSLIAFVLVLVTAVALAPLLQDLPSAALAAIIIVSVLKLIDVREMRSLYRLDKRDFALGMTGLAGVLVFGTLPGLVMAVVAALAALVIRGYRPNTAVLGRFQGGGTDEDYTFRDVGRHPELETFPGLIIFRYDNEIFFANANYLRDQIRSLVREASPAARSVLVDAGAISYIDTTGLDVLKELTAELSDSGIRLLFARVRGPVREILRRSGVEELIGRESIYPTVRAGVAAYLREGRMDEIEGATGEFRTDGES